MSFASPVPQDPAAATAAESLALASVQQVIWLDQVLAPSLPSYNVGVALRIDGEFDAGRLLLAIEATAAAHDALRLVLRREAGLPVQAVLPQVEVTLPLDDFSGRPDAEAQARACLARAFATPFALYDAPPWSMRLVRVDAGRCYWLQCYHHLVLDGIGVALVNHAVLDAYARQGRGEPAHTGPAPSYLEFLADDAAYLASPRYRRDAEFWAARYAQLPPPLLAAPADGEAARAAGSGQLFLELARADYDALTACAEAAGCTAPHFVLALLAAGFARAGRLDQVVIGVPVHNRGTARQKRTVGMFSSIIPLGIAVDLRQSFAALMQGVAAELRRCYRHQRFPVAEINRGLQLARHGRKQLFDVSLALEGFAGDVYLDGRRLEVDKMHHGFEQTPLAVCVRDYHRGHGVTVEFNYNRAAFEREAVEGIRRRFDAMLRAVLAGGAEQAVEALPWLDAHERALLAQWNATARPYPAGLGVHRLFEAQARRTPAAIALEADGAQLDYAGLNARANRLARRLAALGVAADRPVAVCAERGTAMVEALLATLKSGGCYLPLDPELPAERLAELLRDSAPAALLVDAAGAAALAGVDLGAVPRLHLLVDAAQWSALAADDLDLPFDDGQLAYVIYTSGSTGKPKGVMNAHRGVVNRLLWMQEAYGLGEHDVVLQKTPFNFDVSVWEFFWPLLAGARLVLARPGGHKDPAYLAGLIEAAGVTTLHFVPSMLQAFLAGDAADRCRSVARIFCSGEALPAALARQCLARLPWAELHNLYGPTEAAVDVTAWPCRPDDARATVPIGRPIANTRIHILDERLQPVPIGVAGELHIGGVQVARGYLNRPELTAERFIDDPFGAVGDRLYKTGDLARWNADGTIEYLGRNDFQVKIRGLRIELGEIEAALAEIDGVREAVVLAREDAGTPGDLRLVAYCTGEVVEAEVLRQQLAQRLPAYMVPAAYVRLESFPLTPNGKLDRKALPAPDGAAYAQREYEAPQGEAETTLATLWAELLERERIGRHDNFFELGGHSLLAVGLIERLHRHGWQADVGAVFGAPTLARLAAALTPAASQQALPPCAVPAGATRITPAMLNLVALDQAAIDAAVAGVDGGAANVQDLYPLVPLQQGILFHHRLAADGDAYLLTALLGFRDRARLERFVAALQQVIDRHDVLRTAFAWQGLTEPLQVVWRRAALPVDFHRFEPAATSVREQLEACFDARRHRLDVRRAPLLRGDAAHDAAAGRWLLRLAFHHLVVDHATLERLLAEARAIERGEAAQLPAPVPFRNFVAQARLGVSEAEHEAFFRRMLGDVEAPTAPFGRLAAHGDGAGLAEVQRLLPPELAQALRQQARRLGVGAAGLLHLAWARVLARLAGQRTVVFGTVLFGRMHGGAEADRALGLFINTLPLRFDVDGRSVEQAARDMQALLVQLLRHEHAPLALAQRCSALPAQTPLFSALLNYRYSAADPAQALGEGIDYLGGEERSSYPVSLDIDDLGQDFRLTAQVGTADEARRLCDFMETAVASLVAALERDPVQPLHALDTLPATERAQLDRWAGHAAELPREACLHELFEAQARRAPEAIALLHGERQLSYAELDARAERLAQRLRQFGVAPDARVALHARRSPELVVALLAILKAGGAYVPLDPDYPAERLAQMLADSGPVALLYQGGLPDELARALDPALPKLDLDQPDFGDTDPVSAKAAERPVAHAGNLAYVIYTSGSTGVPKGVMVEHRSVVNQVTALAARLGLEAGQRMLQFASPSFDASVEEVFATLASGATLVLRSDAWLADAATFWDLCAAQRIAVVDLPTQFWTQLALARRPIPTCVRWAIIGGEAVGEAALRAWFDGPGSRPRLLNTYGPTEATVSATALEVAGVGDWRSIGRPSAKVVVRILDALGQLVPVGVAGELHIGGVQLARGYLNRPELTAERFVDDPFGEPGERLYKTGDLARWKADGTIDYLGRNDFQVKIRGFRIELGEIEARLAEVDGVREAVVLAREEAPGAAASSDVRLVAYYLGEAVEAEQLRRQLAQRLPAYMVPAAYVWLDAFPLTPNGKLDRKVLPAPDGAAYAQREYEAPQGETETTLAALWAELLKLDRVGRHDNFFELGGHSLLAVSLIERLRQAGLHSDVRGLFAASTLAELATRLGRDSQAVAVPPNLIEPGAERITPAMLPLVQLSQAEIDVVVAGVDGGTANVQDIYPLAPLQEGILFHHLSAREGDPYLVYSLLGFKDRARLDGFLAALRQVIARHDILRTGIVWQGLPQPVQVVWRQVELPLEHLVLDPADGEIADQLAARNDPRRQRLDVGRAPLLRCQVAEDAAHGRWLLGVLSHHLAGDHASLRLLLAEADALEREPAAVLPPPVPFRDFVAQARLGVGAAEHEAFFGRLLGDIDAPTLPFGLAAEAEPAGGEARLPLPAELVRAMRAQARRLGVGMASLLHLAWALVLARAADRRAVVFGTVLFGRMHGGAGAERALGLFINTLPLRFDVDGRPVEQAVRDMQALLAELLRHEHASLALAQRCSALPAQAPLFAALLNYRQGEAAPEAGIELLAGRARAGYPLTLSVDDLGDAIELTVQAAAPLAPQRVGGFVQAALAALLQALRQAPAGPLDAIDVLPAAERQALQADWDATAMPAAARPVHRLFEAQAARTPDAPAIDDGERCLSYAELNARANRLARRLRAHGVGPERLAALAVDRSIEMMVGLLAILKAGGAYLPLDPAYPPERLARMLDQAGPVCLLAPEALAARLPATGLPRLDAAVVPDEADGNLDGADDAAALAYVIYTSGSTGVPKGVMVEHRQLANLWTALEAAIYRRHPACRRVGVNAPLAFDSAVKQWLQLLSGRTLVLVPAEVRLDGAALRDFAAEQRIDALDCTPSQLGLLLDAGLGRAAGAPAVLLAGGEPIGPALWQRLAGLPATASYNVYGPTECTVDSTAARVAADEPPHIGRAVANARVYLLDAQRRPVPVGTAGEIHIGGAGVARGYLGQPALTAERFLADPFGPPGARMYRTGDLARRLPGGALEYLGRNDFQLKIRGFRIEPGEIEARLAEVAGVREVAVLAREDAVPGDLRLVAYFTGAATAEALRRHAAGQLPPYMAPAAYVRLDAFPLTPNGKLDRRALPAPDGAAYARRDHAAPQGETETALAALWAELLGLDRVGRHDNFFELGGHSLLAVSLIARMRQAGLPADVQALFTAPTLAELAARIEPAALAGAAHRLVDVPPNLIPYGAETPLNDLEEFRL
ncbi:non-ribosomal peptide synthetase [Chitinimonas koreensis]|uniref:non-ribosomal peptide synthetase n=2 Tax=Chitinimonas koreensis TaxID=356302 RepID=UPI00165465E8|nr:non-ribosomal peptide synthetase [Chitinimonas koreensis]QNM97394.1 amino acid adenylation domain-containing protein [Chitinimonas koreensis]